MSITDKSLTLKILKKRYSTTTEMKNFLSEGANRRYMVGKLAPSLNKLVQILNLFGLPTETVKDCKLSWLSVGHIILIKRLQQFITEKNISKASELLDQLELIMEKTTYTMQEFLLLKAQVFELQKVNTRNILKIIDSALLLTYPTFSLEELSKTALLFVEPELIHIKAKSLAEEGDNVKAISILTDLLESMNLYSMTDKNRDKIFVQVYVTLANLHYKIGKFKELFNYCEQGIKLSIEIASGKFNPEFDLLIAMGKFKYKNDREGSRLHFMYAFVGFFLLGNAEKSKSIIKIANEKFGMNINLLGMDKLNFLIKSHRIFERSEPIDCKSIAQLIDRLCHQRGIKTANIYGGIISQQAYSKVISNQTEFDYINAEAMGQRLGIEIEIYDHYLVGTSEFNILNLRDAVNRKFVTQNFNGIDELLADLERYNLNGKSYKVITQYIKFLRTSQLQYNGEISSSEFRKALIDIMKETQPDFNEFSFASLYFTHTESMIANSIALSYADGEEVIAMKLYDEQLKLYKGIYTDEADGYRMLSALLSNYSTKGRISGNINKALGLLFEALTCEMSNKSLILSHVFLYNIACAYIQEEKCKADITAYFLLSYYSASSMANYCNHSKITAKYAKEKLETSCGVFV